LNFSHSYIFLFINSAFLSLIYSFGSGRDLEGLRALGGVRMFGIGINL
jgi:hypothetical protein